MPRLVSQLLYLSLKLSIASKMARANQPISLKSRISRMTKQRQGIQSTAPNLASVPQRQPDPPSFCEDIDSSEFSDPSLYHHIFTKLIATSGFVAADLSDQMEMQSVRGHGYVFFIWNNYIHYEPMVKEQLSPYESATEFFRSKNCILDFFRLDNETSGPLETFMKANARSFQYVPPINHRAYMAEIAVRDGKTHLITILCGVHPSFPNGDWGLLVPFAELTLSLLRTFGPDPSNSAHTGVYGPPYDFAAHPLAPAGCLCVGFTASDVRP